MKQCPQCKSTYSDDTLSYCLTDGTALVDHDPAKTEDMNLDEVTSGDEARRTAGGPIRIDLPRDIPEEEIVTAEELKTGGESKGISPLLIGIFIAGILLLLGVAVSVGIYAILVNRDAAPETANLAEDKGPDEDVEELRKRLEELSNKLDQANSNANGEPGLKLGDDNEEDPDDPEFDEEYIMRVNSPNDGFLALRSAPDTEKGARLAKIPHGAIVTIESCQPNKVRIGSRTGRWCRAVYEGMSGWVYDAWLVP